VARKRGRGKDIAGQIVQLFRENNGRLSLTYESIARDLDCTLSCVAYIFKKLLERRIIVNTNGDLRHGLKGPKDYYLLDLYAKDDSWRDVFKKSHSLKTSKRVSHKKGFVSESVADMARELVKAHRTISSTIERCDQLIGENKNLFAEIKKLKARIDELEDEARIASQQSAQNQKETMELENQLQEARGQTRRINFDKRGIQATM
jgi:regulator of replication initiation timing